MYKGVQPKYVHKAYQFACGPSLNAIDPNMQQDVEFNSSSMYSAYSRQEPPVNLHNHQPSHIVSLTRGISRPGSSYSSHIPNMPPMTSSGAPVVHNSMLHGDRQSVPISEYSGRRVRSSSGDASTWGMFKQSSDSDDIGDLGGRPSQQLQSNSHGTTDSYESSVDQTFHHSVFAPDDKMRRSSGRTSTSGQSIDDYRNFADEIIRENIEIDFSPHLSSPYLSESSSQPSSPSGNNERSRLLNLLSDRDRALAAKDERIRQLTRSSDAANHRSSSLYAELAFLKQQIETLKHIEKNHMRKIHMVEQSLDNLIGKFEAMRGGEHEEQQPTYHTQRTNLEERPSNFCQDFY